MLILPSLLGITETGSLSAVLILFCALSAFFFPRSFRKKKADRNNRRFSHILVLLLLIMILGLTACSTSAQEVENSASLGVHT